MNDKEWEVWMQKRGIYIPTEEEVRKAKELGLVKVKRNGGVGNERKDQKPHR